ncbi:hypothetical protein ACYX79_05575 [Stenotrophomonas rhizophila]
MKNENGAEKSAPFSIARPAIRGIPRKIKGMDETDYKRSTRRWAFLFWATMDAVQIAFYALSALQRGRIPYVDDAHGSLAVLQSHGYATLLTLVPSWMLQASLIASAVLLLRHSRYGVLLAYAQIPLRLVFLVPSVPFALSALQGLTMAPTASMLMAVGLMLVIELLKMGTLRRKPGLSAGCGDVQ